MINRLHLIRYWILVLLRIPTVLFGNVKSFPKAYIIHYTKLVERKKHLSWTLEKFGIPCLWIEEYDRDDLTDAIVSSRYNFSQHAWNERTNTLPYKVTLPLRRISDAEISCTIKFQEAINAVASGSDSIALILEDDAVFLSKNALFIRAQIDLIMTTIPADCDVLFIGGGFSHKILSFKNKKSFYWLADHPSTNCASSFLITKKAATKVMKTFETFATISDMEFNYQFYKNELKVYHTFPYCMGQGSVTGSFQSSLR